ncbi:Aste57867_24429 [Aphanomyces stellatus]|uniref:Aste57867_24429 protein n=1 Tax=Aphanomyces stellatus TaxID=120398 RepID=A0A485LQC3_9STRA|nr:hypothetical protein As57867_024353 [Aphanomyces stellatus]VFU01069.1 Aste57867_24429 [Aphanomyces stellatus]
MAPPLDRLSRTNPFVTQASTWQCFVALVGYILFVTDVLRAGSGLENLSMPLVEPNLFHEIGPVQYSVANYSSTAAASVGSVISLDQAYSIHPTSLGMRSVATHLNVSFADPFASLDAFIDGLISSASSSSPSCVRMASRLATNNYLDSSNLLAPLGLTLPQASTSRTVWATQFSNWTSASSLCVDLQHRPLLCEKPWGFFPPVEPSIAEPASIWASIERVASTSPPSIPNSIVDVTVIEAESDPLMVAGSGILVARGKYDVVVLTRVQSCPVNASACTTVSIQDYRYEGQLLYSDVQEWYWTLTVVRWVGQGYNIIRLVALFAGCLQAASGSSWLERSRRALNILCLIPPQVVVFGSWIPLVCYSAAHLADVTNLIKLSWPEATSAASILQMVAVHMRIVWVLALVLRVALYFHNSTKYRSGKGYWGVKGHCFGVVAFLSMLVLAKTSVPLPATLLQSWQVEPSMSVAFVRGCVTSTWMHTTEGIYSELLAVLCVVGLGSACNLALWLYKKVMHCENRVANDAVTPNVVLPSAPFMPHLYLAPTVDVPFAAGVLWDATMLSVCWDVDVLDVVHPPATVSLDERFGLMNIAGLTDPLNFFLLRFEAKKLVLYRYETTGPAKTTTFLHPLSAQNLKPYLDKLNQTESPKVLSVHAISTLSWTDIIGCH